MPKTFKVRPINSYDGSFDYQVDIIVPYHGQYGKVVRLLDSIFRLTRSNYFKLIVVDDCSPNRTLYDRLTKNPHVKAIRSESHVGFGGACKRGFEASESPYVCFVNSDCIVEDINWLRSMGNALLNMKDQGVKMVAPKTNNPVNGTQQLLGKKGEPSEDVVLGADEILSMYCFMCHRELFNRCGGFLKAYPYFGYEDEEFAARMRHYGFKQGIAGSGWIYHEGEQTIRAVARDVPEAKDSWETNHALCVADIASLKNRM